MRTPNFSSKRSIENNGIRQNLDPSSQNNKRAGLEYYIEPSLVQNRLHVEHAITLTSGVLFIFILEFICYFD